MRSYSLGILDCAIKDEDLATSKLNHGVDSSTCHTACANDETSGLGWLDGISRGEVSAKAREDADPVGVVAVPGTDGAGFVS
jgi:hypothetical protein